MNDHTKLFVKILEITEYDGEKEVFANMFTNLIYEEAFYQLIQALPENRKKSVGMKWDVNRHNPAALISLINKNFTTDQVNDATQKAAAKAIKDYLFSLTPNLTAEQIMQLQKLSQEFPRPN